eukprot:m.236367 g.236367  ORF g.236367 m.236367 type:complete len:195 (+) comp16047_c1_seq1:105-689(+)
MDTAKAILAERDEIIKQIEKYNSFLNSCGLGKDEPLVDQDGYPRGDVDVVGIRKARSDVARLQTDLKAVMARMEKALHEVHAATIPTGNVRSEENTNEQHSYVEREAFARVGDVKAGSPAAYAGLEIGDVLLIFGSVNASNFTGMADIATVVKNSIGKVVRVMVKRNETSTKLLPLKPGNWSGQGLLGCQIIPL